MVWGINLRFKKNSLTIKVWTFFILFSVFILTFLWLFQIVFLNHYYEYEKTRNMKTIGVQIKRAYQSTDREEALLNLSYDKEVCIDINYNGQTLYSTNRFRGCLMDEDKEGRFSSIKTAFELSNKTAQMFKIMNPRLDNMTLVYALKLDSNTVAYINTSLVPLDSTTYILAKQLIYVTMIVLILSFVLAYFMSKKISSPIVKINETAKLLANGDYTIRFDQEEDIDELNQLATTLNYTRAELAQTEALRRELMANVGHDLKTPLTMIKAYAEMVRDLNYQNAEKRNANLNVIIEECDHLNLLVNDIIELSKMQSNICDLQLDCFDLHSLIEQILNRYTILKEQGYEFIYQNIQSIEVIADKRKITQVIYNLVNNAVQYVGKDKQIEILLREINGKVRVEIKDHGKGIDPEDISHIWERYYQTKKQHQRNKIGSGLGLCIVKEILKQHQCIFGVESEKGQGTVFWFELNKK